MLPTILTAGGTYFSFANPAQSVFSIESIAHALSNICRFGGHSRQFYSVAQHSVYVAQCSCVAPEDKLAALMHDAHEAFVGDVPSPLKTLLPDFKALEHRIEAEVHARFGIREQPPSVKEADRILLATEQRDLMPPHDDDWAIIAGVKPLPIRIRPWSSPFAKDRFLELYRKLEQAQADRSAA